MSKRKQRHIGQWMNVDGEPVHVLADPNMSDGTRDALLELVRAARKMVENRKPDIEGLKAFTASDLLDTLEHYLSQLNWDTGRNVVVGDTGWQDWKLHPFTPALMYALRDAELLEMRYVRDNSGFLTGTEYRITQAGIRYLQERRP
jgi:hypothetical protein